MLSLLQRCRPLLFGLALLCGWLAGSQEVAAQTTTGLRLEYLLRVRDPGLGKIELEARFSGLPQGLAVLELGMLEQYAFARLPEPRLEQEPTAQDAAGHALALQKISAHRWRLETQAAPLIHLSWEVRLDHRLQANVAAHSRYELPYLAPDHGLLVMAAVLLLPENQQVQSSRVRFDLPGGWPIIAPWQCDADGVYHPKNRRELSSNLVAIGNWSSFTVEQGETQVLLAFAPGQADLQAKVLPLIRPVLALELELFRDQPFERYLLLFGRADAPGLAGSPKTGAMALSVDLSGSPTESLQSLVHLLAHEFFHTWAAAHFDAPDELRFVNEGFTEFFALLVQSWTGYTSWDRLGAELGKAMSSWEASAAATGLSLVEAGGEPFFTNMDANRAVYSGGTVLAALYDLEIRRAQPGHSLIDLLRSLHNDPRWQPQGVQPTLADLAAKLGDFVGNERAAELLLLAQQRATPDIAALFAAAGARVAAALEPASLDFRVLLEGRRLSAIEASDLARRIGLQVGDELLAIHGREVTTEAEARAAWREPRQGRIQVRYRRGESTHDIDVALPEVRRYRVDGRAWYPLSSAVSPSK